MAETTELCEGFEDAPFCAGPSMTELADGTEVAEDGECTTVEECQAEVTADAPWEVNPTTPLPECWVDEDGCVGPASSQTYDAAPANDTSALGEAPGSPDPVDVASCETDGTCDDSCTPPARGDCTATEAPAAAPPPAELPATGLADVTLLAAVALALVTGGARLRRFSR